MTQPAEIVRFWTDAGPDKWFAEDEAFDAEIRARFEAAHHAAARGAFAAWEENAEGAFALLLLLDQFPRNLYRGSAHAFATDPIARNIAARAITHRFDQAFETPLRIFFYMPFEHSEDAREQARAVSFCEAMGDAEYLKYAKLHAGIIARFGRFPHRNAVLGRASTEPERDFLAHGGFKG